MLAIAFDAATCFCETFAIAPLVSLSLVSLPLPLPLPLSLLAG